MARSYENWKYRVTKKMKHRAQKFMDKAMTAEERDAWGKVIQWLDDILSSCRFVTKKGAIGLRGKVEELVEGYDGSKD